MCLSLIRTALWKPMCQIFKLRNLEIYWFSGSGSEISFGSRTNSITAKGLMFWNQILHLCSTEIPLWTLPNTLVHIAFTKGYLSKETFVHGGSFLYWTLSINCLWNKNKLGLTCAKLRQGLATNCCEQVMNRSWKDCEQVVNKTWTSHETKNEVVRLDRFVLPK